MTKLISQAKLPTGPFREGDRVQLTGPKGRLNTITLRAGEKFGTHRGDLLHDEIIGKPEGSVVLNQTGIEYLAFRPLLSDFVSVSYTHLTLPTKRIV